jgi:hypothetical protein
MMEENLIEWLLDEDNPSIQYFTLVSLLDKSFDDPMVIKAKKAIMTEGAVPALLNHQSLDGTWGIPERFYRDKYAGTIWNLLILAELAADPGDVRIKKTCEFVLQHSQDPFDGGFSYEQSKKTGSGLPSGVVPCLTGNMVYSLIKLGYLDDQRLQKAIDWICANQRTDDAAAEPPFGKVYERYEMCWGTHSCHMGVAKALKALAQVPLEKRTPGCMLKIGELTEYFLEHHIYKKSHRLDQTARPGWLRFGFPLMYQTDVLELLELFANLGIRDRRLDDAIALTTSKRMSDGKWKLENSNNGKTLINIEKKGQASKWITLRALKILKFYGSTNPARK